MFKKSQLNSTHSIIAIFFFHHFFNMSLLFIDTSFLVIDHFNGLLVNRILDCNYFMQFIVLNVEIGQVTIKRFTIPT